MDNRRKECPDVRDVVADKDCGCRQGESDVELDFAEVRQLLIHPD